LVLDTQKSFKLRTIGKPWVDYRSLLIRENIVHQLDTNNGVQLIIYLDPESTEAQSIKKCWLGDQEMQSLDRNIFHLMNSFELQQALLSQHSSVLENLISKILASLSQKMDLTDDDKRIELIEQSIAKDHLYEITIPQLAKLVYLSPSLLRSLFKSTPGISIYKYILWNKIRFATNYIMAGHSVGDTAIQAGFTDSSHFHKMMVQVFGISPSRFLKNNKTRYRVICEPTSFQLETSLCD
jgi:AraC-like DNA-binding protein